MSLARTLLNGGMMGSTIDANRYGHQEGATRIAMESMEELHEIFIESFYNVEQAELAAACEGVVLEGSQYEPVAEAAISNGIEKVKNFLKKLLEKVKAFFHAIRRYIDGILMSGKDFVKKYKDEIKKLPNFKDYTVKMYKYDKDAIDEQSSTDAATLSETIINKADLTGMQDILDGKYVVSANAEKTAKPDIEDLDMDNIEKKIVIELTKSECNDPDEYSTYLFGKYRNGAEDSSDMEEMELSNSDIVNMMNELINSKGISKITTAESKTNAGYSKAIKKIEKVADAAEKLKNKKGEASKWGAAYAKAARQYSSAISTAQGYVNTMFSEWKKAYGERDAAYKRVITGAFSYAKKYDKNNK